MVAASFLIAALVGGFFWSGDAIGQTMCGQRGAVVASLKKNYSEVPVSMGLASNGSVVEVLAAPSGSFTIIVTRPSGLSCIMAAGEKWEDAPSLKGPPKGEPI